MTLCPLNHCRWPVGRNCFVSIRQSPPPPPPSNPVKCPVTPRAVAACNKRLRGAAAALLQVNVIKHVSFTNVHALQQRQPPHVSVFFPFSFVTPNRRHGKDVIERDAAFPLPLTIHHTHTIPPAAHSKGDRRNRSSARVAGDQHVIAVKPPSSDSALARTAAPTAATRACVGGCSRGGDGGHTSGSEMSSLSSCDERCSATQRADCPCGLRLRFCNPRLQHRAERMTQ